MSTTGPSASGQDLVTHPSNKAPTSNPFAGSASITLSVPDSVEVKLVDASALGDYEVWIFLASILCSAVTGFMVAIIQAPDNDKGKYVAITVVFGLLASVCVYMALTKRQKLTSKARRMRFHIGDQISDD